MKLFTQFCTVYVTVFGLLGMLFWLHEHSRKIYLVFLWIAIFFF